MKYFALALALSSFTFVGCSKKKHICDDMVAKLEECHAKATGDNKTQVAALVKELKDGLKEEGYTADNEK